jgi:hypothetical protein
MLDARCSMLDAPKGTPFRRSNRCLAEKFENYPQITQIYTDTITKSPGIFLLFLRHLRHLRAGLGGWGDRVSRIEYL